MKCGGFEKLRRVLSVCACACLLAGCGAAQLSEASGLGGVKLYTGEVLPTPQVLFDHPANARAAPVNNALWNAGHKIAELHCNYMDATGQPNRITFFGVANASDLGNVEGLFGGKISSASLLAAKSNVDRQNEIFAETIWKQANGDPARIRTLLKEAVAHDADCERKQYKALELIGELARQNQHPSRDEAGRPVVIPLSPDKAQAMNGRVKALLEMRARSIPTLASAYQMVGDALSKRTAAASAPTSRPSAKSAEKAQPASVKATKITVDTAPLRAVEQETMAAIARSKAFCLHKAAVDCS